MSLQYISHKVCMPPLSFWKHDVVYKDNFVDLALGFILTNIHDNVFCNRVLIIGRKIMS